VIKRFEFQIDETQHKKRLDDFLFGTFSDLGKRFLRDVLKEEKCEVNGYVANGGLVLKQNDFVEIEFDYSAQNKMFPEEIPLEIIFEDAEIIVLNKPAGMLIHPTPRNRSGTLLNGLMHYLNRDAETRGHGDAENLRHGDGEMRRRGGDGETGKISEKKEQGTRNKVKRTNGKDRKIEDEKQRTKEAKKINGSVSPRPRVPASQMLRPGLVHRLDRQTSGLVVIAKNARALRILNGHFKRKLVEKKYLAVVEGIFKEDSGKIEAPIGRYEELRQWNVKADGKSAETRFWVKERFADKTLLELEPVTGRTNQLRIHCAYIGHPILGDEWHGRRKFPRLCLHASRLEFWHPDGGERLKFESGLPEDFELLI
jgi:23S rRNA-/tRNA-specific pseudouridylate synthase